MNDDTTTQVTPSVSTTERRWPWKTTASLQGKVLHNSIKYHDSRFQPKHTNNLFLEDICACPTCDTVAASVSEKLHFKDVNAPSYYDGDRSNGNKWHLKTEACKSCKDFGSHWRPRMSFCEFAEKYNRSLGGKNFNALTKNANTLRSALPAFKRLFVPNFKDNLSAKLAAIDGTASATTANSESEDKSLEGSNLDMSQLPIRIRDTDTNEETLEENGCSEGGDGMGSERVGLPFRTACDEA